jgi:drug/metabolite transporter (DMT)-like permease
MSLRDFGLMLAVCLTWAANNILSKYVVSDMGIPPLLYASARFAVLSLATLPFLFPMPRPRWRLILVALLMGGGNFAIFFVGLKLSTPSSAAVVLQLGLPATILLSVLILGERIGPRRVIGMALTFAGALIVMWDPHGLAISPGLALVALAALMGSFGAVFLKQLEGVRPLTYQAWVGFASFWPLAALSVLLEPGQIQAGIDAGWPFVAAVLFSALVVSLAAHSGYYILMQRYEANLISALTLLTPLSTIALGVAILHDPFGLRMAAGALLALGGVLVIILRGNRVQALLMALRGYR